jgi:hypothetical protein
VKEVPPDSGQEQDGNKILLDPKIVMPDPVDPEVNPPKMIRVQVEFVDLSHEKLTELLFMADPPSADATAMRKQIQALVKKGEAKVMETLICTARSGEKALGESINEFIYPTEYEPPELPSTVGIPDKDDGLTPDEVKLLRMLRTPPTPTSFETRNLGSTLEIEPTLNETGDLIDLRFAPEMVWHTGETVWVEEKDSEGNVSKIQMPKIYTMRVTTALTCREGQYVMAAVQSPKDADGTTDFSRKVMVFVKCDTLVVKK